MRFTKRADAAQEYATMDFSTADVRIVPLPQAQDALTDVLRQGAQKLLAQAIDAEVADWLERHQDCRNADGRRQVVRNGYLPERTITTGLGPVAVKQPRVHDRRPPGEREKFTSAILPPYLRKTKSVEELIPWLYLKGVSTGDFSEALAALLGPDAKATVHSPAGENCVNGLATAKGFSQIGGHAAGDQPRTDCPTASGSPSHHSDVAGEDPGVGSASEPVPSEFFAAAEYRTPPRQAPETQVPNETQAGWSTGPPQI